jgi:hypothetical protein
MGTGWAARGDDTFLRLTHGKVRMTEGFKARDVAEFMVKELEAENGCMRQNHIADRIQEEFGDAFVYENDNGNLAISKVVLKEFRRRTEDTVVWLRGEKAWRWRDRGDESGRQQYV